MSRFALQRCRTIQVHDYQRTRLFISVSLAGAAMITALCSIVDANEGPSKRPNVVLLMADDMGWGDVGYNGHPVLKTPHLDAMSRAGLRFDRFYAPTVCSPTRGSCLTGRHPYRYGIFTANVGTLPLEEQTIAEDLKSLGYSTGHFGKWHLGTLTNDIQDGRRGGKDPKDYSPPWLHGFDAVFSTEQAIGTWDPGNNPIFNTHYWNGPGDFATTNLEGDDSRVMMDRAIPFIQKAAKADQPFLAVIWFHAPHEPVKAGPKFRALYAGESEAKQHYYGCITALDEQVGRLRQELRDLKVAGNTLVWFCSDNGPEGKETAPGSSGPFRGRKRDLWEGGVRLPAILEWPDQISSARVTDIPCTTMDFVPTIRDFLRTSGDPVSPIDGVSIRSLIEGKPFERSKPIGFEFGNTAAWVDGRHKLVALLEPAPKGSESNTNSSGDLRPITQVLLYDVVSDPHEDRDGSEQNVELTTKMKKELEAWRKDCQRSNSGRDYR